MNRLSRDRREYPFEFSLSRKVQGYPSDPAEGVRFDGDILEVGPGLGHLLLELCQASPEERFLAIEIGNKRFNRMAEKAARSGIENLTLLKGAAQALIPKYLKLGSLKRIYVLFPDPWPKTRHGCNRLLTPDFIAMLACLLKPGGELFVATDHEPYAKWILQAANQVPALENRGSPFCDVSQVADYIPTVFEQKWRGKGLPIFYMSYLRSQDNVAVSL